MDTGIRHRLALFGCAAVATLALTACGDAEPSSPPTRTTPVTTVTVTDEQGSPTPTTQNTSPTPTAEAVPTARLPLSAPAVGAALTVTDIRVGAHSGYDRVVVEFGGKGTPGYDLRFTDDPRQDGSGDPVSVPGRSVIQLVINGVRYPGDTGIPEFTGPKPVPGLGQVTQVNWFGVFEGQQRLFVGVDADQPAVRVSTLTGPTRLVLDIAH